MWLNAGINIDLVIELFQWRGEPLLDDELLNRFAETVQRLRLAAALRQDDMQDHMRANRSGFGWRRRRIIGLEHMNGFRDRAQRYHRAIHDVLIKEWDPIGVGHVPEAQDEYDSYVPGVYKHLIHRLPERDLFEYLWKIETEHMGLQGNRLHTEKTTRHLIGLIKEIEEGNTQPVDERDSEER